MNAKRKVELFSAGCPACDRAVELLRRIACPSCEVAILDMRDPAVAQRAEQFGVRSVPAVVVDGKLAACCATRGVDEASLRQEGVSVPRS
jgi:glutaredoxin 3